MQNKDTQTSGASKSSISTKSTTRIGDNENKISMSKNEMPASHISQKNKNIQTHGASQSSISRICEKENRNSKSKSNPSSINFSRGSRLDETSFDNDIFENSILKLQSESNSPLSTRLDISQINSNKSLFGNGIENMASCEIPPLNNYVGYSLLMVSLLLDGIVNDIEM